MNTWVVVNKISQLTNSLNFVSSWSVPLSIIHNKNGLHFFEI